jgi:hypothetical protein
VNPAPPGGERLSYRRANAIADLVLVLVVLLLQQARATPAGGGSVELWGHRVPEVCLSRRILGRPCPTCGLTRAVVLLLDGRVREARAMHRSAPWVALWLAAQIIWRVALALSGAHSRRLVVGDVVVSGATLLAATYLPLIFR